jgi:hypothetical protein
MAIMITLQGRHKMMMIMGRAKKSNTYVLVLGTSRQANSVNSSKSYE